MILFKYMKSQEAQQNISNLESAKSAALLTDDKLKSFRKLPIEEQKKQQEDRLQKLEELQNEFRKAVEEATKTGKVEEAQKLKVAFDKDAEELKQLIGTPEISAEYISKDKKGKETRETIEIDFEKRLEQSINFYKNHSIDIPDDFAEKMKDIWERNQDEIKNAIEEKGFDEILLIPENVPLEELDKKMTEGYKSETYLSDNFKSGGSWSGVKEDNETRMVLVHKKNAQNLKDHPLLKETLGKTAEFFIKAGEKLNLTDYEIFQREYFEETRKHLDEDGWTWLPGSKSGSRVVSSDFNPGDGQVYVDADDPGSSGDGLGCRLSRSFK